MTPTTTFETALERLRATATYDVEALRAEIAETIYVAMQDRGITNAELARRMGTSRAYITVILQGNANFTVQSLVKIARALSGRVDISFHFTSTVNKEQS